MASEEGGGRSLTETFKKVNHWRHWLMDISMIGMAVGAVVASGGTFGFLDPIASWMKMHVTGIPELLEHGGEFIEVASAQAGEGTWYAGTEIDHSAMHGGGEVHHAPDVSGTSKEFSHAAHGQSATHEQVASLTPEDKAKVLGAADDRGLDRGRLLELIQSHDR